VVVVRQNNVVFFQIPPIFPRVSEPEKQVGNNGSLIDATKPSMMLPRFQKKY